MSVFNPNVLANMQVNPKQLFNAEIHGELDKLVENSFRYACEGHSKNFLHNIDLYLQHAPSAYNMYYEGEFNYLMSKADIMKVKPNVLENLSKNYVAILGVLHNYVCVGIDCGIKGDNEKPTYDNALYTRNIDILRNLAKVGLLENPQDIEKHVKDLEGAKTANGFKDETVHAIKLSVVGLKGKHPIFSSSSPRSRVSAGVGKDMVFIPVAFYYRITDILAGMLKDRAFRFIKQTEFGAKKHIATFSQDTVRKFYADCPAELVETKIKKTRIGFDVARIRIMAYDLESSVNSLGTASFRPEMLDEIRPTRANMVDKSMHNMNYDSVVSVYQSKVKKLTVAQLREVKFFDVKSFATAKEAQEGLIEYGNQLSPKELYMLMKQNNYLFGDVDTAINTRDKTSPKVLKSLKLVDIENLGEQERVDLIKDMLNRGLVKVTAISKSNKVFEKLVTNNSLVLERFLGKDYVCKYESIRHRIEHIKGMVESGEINSKAELEKVAVQYDILSYVNSSELFDKSIDKGFNGKAVSALDTVISDLSNSNRGKLAPNMIRCRNIKATDSNSFYGTFNVNNIINIEFAEYVEPKKSDKGADEKAKVSKSKK